MTYKVNYYIINQKEVILLRLSRNLIIAIFSLFLITVISVTVVMIIYFNSYIVTYDLDGGEMDETETRVWAGSEYSLPSPTKQGYAFAGWYLEGKYFLPEGVWEIEDDVTLTAKWGLRDENGVVYNKVDNGYVIESYNGGVVSNIVFPLKYNGEPVVGIVPHALDMLKGRMNDALEGFVKVYIPSTAIAEQQLSLFEGIMACRYNSVDRNGFIYLENESSVKVVGYTGNYGKSILVPADYKGKPIDGIGCFAFYGSEKFFNGEITDFYRILIPESVTTVGEKAFALCNEIKASIYYVKDGKARELIDLSRLYDWIEKAKISTGNDELVKVITQILPAFGWSEYTSANYYVRFNANGGEIVKKVQTVNSSGETVSITVKIKDTTLKKNKSYTLPTPTREGYTFDGWCYGETLVPQEGTRWGYDTHVELSAKWTEIQKEG